ncbi:hypothetical protein CSO01_20770 [Cellulomonas soli]|uniref:Helix-turn-helix domain-containing protein n=1 Tax=Cellulomonas soli TaxID=931535 RepID=A0A512PE01_9CELL|nr:hypothetical protein CSO01_20770 [Cellulomonas soli]
MESRTRTHPNAPDAPPLAFPLPAAARHAGISIRTLRYAIARGEIAVHRPSSRPVVLATDLQAWLEGAPADRAAAPRRPATGRAA